MDAMKAKLKETEYCGFKLSYFRKLMMRRVIPMYKPCGKLCFFKKEDLDAFLTSQQVGFLHISVALQSGYTKIFRGPRVWRRVMRTPGMFKKSSVPEMRLFSSSKAFRRVWVSTSALSRAST